ncbi:zinc ribbon domain-containing protein [Actinocrispum sp. NPDC049592]|uniref:double zinc ribbon domain-containing protein n=1 Tax=Actinocrispum sp. NPDC049592 TaxID=3154835 RepID=UPI00341C016D
MVAPVPFTGNVRDMCNENGFQWEFHCNRCNNGFQSPFEQNIASRGKGLLRMAGEWFGGKVETLSSGVEDFNRYSWSGEGSATKDRHFAKAVELVRPNFRQCRACGRWVCAQFCWNNDVGQCMECSPLIAEEIARAQSDAQRYQFREKAFEQDWTSHQNLAEVPKLRCDSCGGSTPGGKFCQHCGQALIKEVHCTQCGTKASPGAMFCAQCGHQL